MDVTSRIRAVEPPFTAAEQRVADVVSEQPQHVAFGTVAAVAAEAGTGAATVMRVCAKLGFDGFTDLQAAVRDEVASRLRPAVERIRDGDVGRSVLERALEMETHNIEATLGSIDRRAHDRAVALLADAERHVVVISGDASRGVAIQFTSDLQHLRPNVELLDGNPVAVGRRLALADRDDVVLALDLRRYDAWLLDSVERFSTAKASVITVCDRATGPLAAMADLAFVVQADAVGPFDSHVGTLALLGTLTAGVARTLRRSATRRLARTESTWADLGALRDR